MRRRGRLFKAFKWAMTLLSVALLALFVASGWWNITSCLCDGSRWYASAVAVGRLWLADIADAEPPGWSWPSINFSRNGRNRPEYNFPDSLINRCDEYTDGIYTIPLQPIVLTVILFTALLWWRDWRKHPPGHCPRCGYDLTGNVSGVCPECGRPCGAAA